MQVFNAVLGYQKPQLALALVAYSMYFVILGGWFGLYFFYLPHLTLLELCIMHYIILQEDGDKRAQLKSDYLFQHDKSVI